MKLSPILINNEKPLYLQLYNYIRDEIMQGNLPSNQKLPSIRELSRYLSISTTTVTNAYDQLLAEGYITSLDRVGYFPKEIVDWNKVQIQRPMFPSEDKYPPSKNDRLDSQCFPFNIWKKCLLGVLNDNRESLLHYGDPQGELSLRKSISRYIYGARGIKCDSSSIVIGSGVQSLLTLLASISKDKVSSIAMESPGFGKAKIIFDDYGYKVVPIPIDKDGIRVALLKNKSLDMVYISPSHQYPLGAVMPIDRRLELLDWSRESKSFIIEDDYDGELRYEGKPIPALKSLDANEVVIYLGSFSKILLPSLRVSYMILPHSLLEQYLLHKSEYVNSSSKTEQLALSNFIDMGAMERHVKRIKKIYSKKQMSFSSMLKEKLKIKVQILSDESGLYILAKLKHKRDLSHITETLRLKGYRLDYIKEISDKEDSAFMIPYSGLDENEMIELVNLIDLLI